MSTALSIQLDEDVKRMLDRFAEKTGIQTDEVINNALRHYLYLREIDAIRKELKPYAQARGFETEDDLLNSISREREKTRL